MEAAQPTGELWPALPLEEWKHTYETLHRWTQIVGKIRLRLSPPVNHWWHVPLYVTARGLTTSPIPYGNRIFELAFDFVDHKLVLHTSDNLTRSIALIPRSVADFYQEVMATLRSAGIDVRIYTTPSEIMNPIPLDQDHEHASYDPEFAQRFWRILVLTDSVFKEFRSRFLGKSSPVHFFWGSFDMAVTRFSGRRAPPREGADLITREAYSHEVSSAGFWPGGGDITGPAFYSYAAPEPNGFSKEPVRPPEAIYHPPLSEFLIMYDDVRRASSPRAALLDFLQSTYEACANAGKWDRAALERQ
jgi:hypothetical protein